MDYRKEIREHDAQILQLTNILRVLDCYGEHDRKAYYQKQMQFHLTKIEHLSELSRNKIG